MRTGWLGGRRGTDLITSKGQLGRNVDEEISGPFFQKWLETAGRCASVLSFETICGGENDGEDAQLLLGTVILSATTVSWLVEG